MNGFRTCIAAALAVAVVAPLAAVGAAGGMREHPVTSTSGPGDGGVMPAAHPRTTNEAVYSKLAAVQSLIDEQDFESARARIDELKREAHLMNDSEQAQVHNMAGFVEFSSDDHWGAVAEYEQLLAQGDEVPSGLRQQTLYTLAQLNFVVEEYQASLRYIRQWMQEAPDPGPTPEIFIGQVYYKLNDYPAAIEHLNIGLDQAREQDVEIRENWWALLGYLYLEQEQWTDAASVLEILNRDYPSEKYRNQLGEVERLIRADGVAL